MARILGHFATLSNRSITVLVATSGDTGSAVAHGFYGVQNVDVVVLYPKGKVSDFQRRQMTTLDENIQAIEIDGTFDDCQDLVKQAFLDRNLQDKYNLTSANSINVARFLPQMVYYFWAVAQLNSTYSPSPETPVNVSVPSGNYGNLTAGLVAKRMGLGIDHFIAAANANNSFPNYLTTGSYSPKPSIATLSNAMDVGAPSNVRSGSCEQLVSGSPKTFSCASGRRWLPSMMWLLCQGAVAVLLRCFERGHLTFNPLF